MTPEKAALWGVIAGGLITLAGTLLTGFLNVGLQWLQTSWQHKNDKRKELSQKRLAALQNCVQMIDFLFASRNVTLGEGGQNMWFRIRSENNCNGALFPANLQEDFAKVIQKVLLLDSLQQSEKDLDYALLERLRAGCVDYIQKEF